MIRDELNISYDTLVIISIGGCSLIKRHEDIIKAVNIINIKSINVLYLHLGEGDALNSEIILSEKYNLKHIIRFYGNQVNVRKFLIASDIYVMTSKFEGISLTTIEAMACRIPAILYNVDGLKDFTTNNAILIDEDYVLLAESIIELHTNSELKEKLSNNAYNFVNNKFNLVDNSHKVFKLYKND